MANCGPGVCAGANAPRCVYYGDAYRMAQSARAEVQLMYPDLSPLYGQPVKIPYTAPTCTPHAGHVAEQGGTIVWLVSGGDTVTWQGAIKPGCAPSSGMTTTSGSPVVMTCTPCGVTVTVRGSPLPNPDGTKTFRLLPFRF